MRLRFRHIPREERNSFEVLKRNCIHSEQTIVERTDLMDAIKQNWEAARSIHLYECTVDRGTPSFTNDDGDRNVAIFRCDI